MIVELPDEVLHQVADAIAERAVVRLHELVEQLATPWMRKDEAVDYCRIPKGTFEKLVAAGEIPSHGGRTQIFHRDELDRALGYVAPVAGSVTSLRRSAA